MITSEERIQLAKIKAERDIKLRQLKGQQQSSSARISQLKNFQIGQSLNDSQRALQELFGSGSRCMFMNPDSQCMPQINGSLTPNRFSEFENPEPNSEDLFGLRKKFKDTANLFFR